MPSVDNHLPLQLFSKLDISTRLIWMVIESFVLHFFFFMFEVWYHVCCIGNGVDITTLFVLSVDLLYVRQNLVEI